MQKLTNNASARQCGKNPLYYWLMKYTRKNTSDTQTQLVVTLDKADLQAVKPKTVARLSKNSKVPGFRPGKVPANIAEKNLDPTALSMEVAQDSINHFVAGILDDEKLQPLDRPQVDVGDYQPGEKLVFTATLEIVPDIKLGDYKALKVKKQTVKVAAKDINEVIERMRSGMGEKKPVVRAAKNGDEVIIDFDGKDKEGKAVAGASGKDYPLNLGSNTFIPGFEEGIVGKKAGDAFDLPLTFPIDYHHKPLAGAKVIFSVTIKEVKDIVLPELNDDFAAKCGPFKTVAELKADVTRELTDQKEREALDVLKDNLVEQLVKGSHVPTPEILITDQVASLERDFTQNLLYRSMTLPQYLEDQKLTKDEWREKELRPQAIRRVQVGLALAELSKAEAIEVSMDELNARLSELMQQYGSQPQMREQLDTPEVRRDVANRVMTEKTIDRLVSLNQ